MDQSTQDMIVSLTQEMLRKLEIEADVSVSDAQDTTLVQIEVADPGILIGYHGRTLESLQLMLSHQVYKQVGSWVRLTLSVGDYWQRRQQQLKDLALTAATQVGETQEPVALTDLSPAERRIVHLILESHEHVYSESEGIGRNRHLVVKPRQK